MADVVGKVRVAKLAGTISLRTMSRHLEGRAGRRGRHGRGRPHRPRVQAAGHGRFQGASVLAGDLSRLFVRKLRDDLAKLMTT